MSITTNDADPKKSVNNYITLNYDDPKNVGRLTSITTIPILTLLNWNLTSILAGLEGLGVANFPTYRNLLSTATRSNDVISEF